MIDELTPEQEALLSVYRDKWVELSFCAEPTDRTDVENACDKLFVDPNYLQPTKIWMSSPEAAARFVVRQIIVKNRPIHQDGVRMPLQPPCTPNEYSESVIHRIHEELIFHHNYGGRLYITADEENDHMITSLRSVTLAPDDLDLIESAWRYAMYTATYYMNFYACSGRRHSQGRIAELDFYLNGLDGAKEDPKNREMLRIAKSVDMWWYLDNNTVVLVESATFAGRDAENRAHAENRAALEYADGWKVYRWHGSAVPEWVILHPETITPEKIDAESNVELRRILLERFGEARYLEASGSAMVCRDDVGELYRREITDDEPIVMVKVKNATLELDGSRKSYWLRVPPTITAPRDGVAWSFQLEGHQYRPTQET